MSLRARMGLAAGVAVAIAVIAVAVSAYLGTRSAVYGQIDDTLQSLAKPYTAPGIGPGGAGQGAQGPRGNGAASRGGAGGGGGDCDWGLGIDQPGGPFGGPEGSVQLLTTSGTVCRSRGDTTAEIPFGSRAIALARSGHGSYFTSTTARGQHIRVLVEGLPGLGALMVALPLTSADRTLANELLLMAVIAAAGVALAALLAVLVARAAVAPISRFTRQAERIADSPEQLERERMTVTGRDELARLARTFNATLNALQRSIAAQRSLVADASHELRTPIASLRANLQLLRDEDLLSPADREAIRSDMIEELDGLTQLVGDVVELARGSKPEGEDGEVRLEDIVSAALERARRRAPGLTFAAGLEPTLVCGDGERIARAVSNLLDNAIKWSPDGGSVEVVLRDGVLSVRDHGPGFHAEDLPFVFDRFHRARDARSKPGSGVCLAIVRQATEAHGGFAEAANAAGGGALMRVGFGPRLTAEPATATQASPASAGAALGGAGEVPKLRTR